MERVTEEQCRTVVAENKLTRIAHRRCSMCGYQTAYLIFDDGGVAFDAGCYCTRGQALRPASFEDLAETFNMQTPEIRARMWQDFRDGKPLID